MKKNKKYKKKYKKLLKAVRQSCDDCRYIDYLDDHSNRTICDQLKCPLHCYVFAQSDIVSNETVKTEI